MTDPVLAVLTDTTHRVGGTIDGDRAWVDADAVTGVLGWSLRPEGLCRGDVCVPVRDPAVRGADGRVDLVALAALLDRPTLVDGETSTVAVGAPRAERTAMLEDRRAPDFALPDLHGALRHLSEWGNRKRLLVAFASW